ncbi:hypothetical protein [Rhodococcus phenolicus]|uniref:hypothetical protein n=1 Tax=Rhodococcus phenolicus TaxID=263849 RepID=UPI0008306281|nr:hypothetical protein [Rhodococcus phenolicus]
MSEYAGGDPGADPAHEWKRDARGSAVVVAAPPGATGPHRLTVTRTTSTTAMQSGTAAEAVRRRCDRLRETGTLATIAETMDGYVVRFTDVDGARVVLTYQEA